MTKTVGAELTGLDIGAELGINDTYGHGVGDEVIRAVATAAGPLHVTISVGLTHLDPADATLDQMLARADHALYQAKQGGRNRVVITAASAS